MYRLDGQLLFRVGYDELVAHIRNRIAYHKDRAAYWLKRVEVQEAAIASALEAVDTVTDRLELKNSSDYNASVHTRDSARAKFKEHDALVRYFEFAVTHLPSEGLQQVNGVASYHFDRQALNALELFNQ